MADNDTSDKLKKATEQASVTPPELRNPTGKGGFGDNPQNRNPGGWRKEVSFSYQYKRFMAMTSKELSEWANTPADKRTVVEDLAYARVVAAKKSLADVKEMTDRTEGKAPQTIGITTEDPVLAILNKMGLGESDAGQAEDTSEATSEDVS